MPVHALSVRSIAERPCVFFHLEGVWGGGGPVPVFHIGLHTFPKVPDFPHDRALAGGFSAVWNTVLRELQLILLTVPKSHHLSGVCVEFPSPSNDCALRPRLTALLFFFFPFIGLTTGHYYVFISGIISLIFICSQKAG